MPSVTGQTMDSTDRTVRIVGVLFLVQLAAALVSHSVIVDPILSGGNLLPDVSANAISVSFAVLLDLICGAAITAIAVLLLPILRQYGERIALWYVVMRVIEFTFLMITGVLLLTILWISREVGQAEASSSLPALAETLAVLRDRAQNMSLVAFSLGAATFYYLLMKTRLIPRFISVWGLLAVLLLFTEVMLLAFGDRFRMALMVPMGLNEPTLGMWLIVKGFRTQPTESA